MFMRSACANQAPARAVSRGPREIVDMLKVIQAVGLKLD
jgi:hypothetical protein